MTQEEKQLLFKDICSRIPYELYFAYKEPEYGIVSKRKFSNIEIWRNSTLIVCNNGLCKHSIDKLKPYLRSLSRMTEEEKKELSYGSADLVFDAAMNAAQGYNTKTVAGDVYVVDWLNAHHFDHRGLIEKGLAIEAPEGMY